MEIELSIIEIDTLVHMLEDLKRLKEQELYHETNNVLFLDEEYIQSLEETHERQMNLLDTFMKKFKSLKQEYAKDGF